MGSGKSKSANFLDDYFDKYERAWNVDVVQQHIVALVDLIRKTKKAGGKLAFAGNGASASISSHCALDFTKQGQIESVCFSSDAFITAFANDYGYERWLTEAFKCHLNENDVAILISSSGKSPNIVNAAEYCVNNGIKVVTLTGFEPENPLRKSGCLNLWVNSNSYNIIECTHMFWLMAACDLLIGKAEYPMS